MQKLVFDEKKFTHLTSVKESVEVLTLYIEKLNKRKLLINNQQAMRSEYDQNEVDILLIKTDWELAKSHKNLAEKNEYLKNFTAKLLEYIDEVNENFDAMSQKAHSYYDLNKGAKKNEIVNALELEFKNIEGINLDTDWDVRIKHYIVLRTIFEQDKKKK